MHATLFSYIRFFQFSVINHTYKIGMQPLVRLTDNTYFTIDTNLFENLTCYLGP
jgi:hypothetical protein